MSNGNTAGSIKIRVETIDYFLRHYREVIIKRRAAEKQIEVQLADYERQLREGFEHREVPERVHNSGGLPSHERLWADSGAA
jgi:hypothetical protein